jgi:hypothetical protein
MNPITQLDTKLLVDQEVFLSQLERVSARLRDVEATLEVCRLGLPASSQVDIGSQVFLRARPLGTLAIHVGSGVFLECAPAQAQGLLEAQQRDLLAQQASLRGKVVGNEAAQLKVSQLLASFGGLQ